MPDVQACKAMGFSERQLKAKQIVGLIELPAGHFDAVYEWVADTSKRLWTYDQASRSNLQLVLAVCGVVAEVSSAEYH